MTQQLHGARTFVRNASFYSASAVITQVSGVLQKLLIRGILPPAALGMWELAVALQGFVGAFDPGVDAAAAVELPVLHGAGKAREETVVRSTVFWTHMVMGAVLACSLLGYAAIKSPTMSWDILSAWITAAALVIFSACSDPLVVFHQGRQSYGALSKAISLTAASTALVMPLGAYYGGLRGLLVAGMFTYALRVLLLYATGRMAGLELAGGWHRPTFIRLIKFGLPLRIIDYPQSLLSFLDVFIITAFIGVEGLAVYATARVVFLQVANMPAVMGNVLIMRLFHMSGSKTHSDRIGPELRTFLVFQYSVLIPCFALAAMTGFAIVTSRFIPAYAEAVPVLSVLLCATFFVPQTSLVRNVWLLQRRLGAIAVSNAVGVVAMAGALAVVWWANDLRLSTVSEAVVVGYAIYFIYLMLTAGSEEWGTGRTLEVLAVAVGGAVLVRVSAAGISEAAITADSGFEILHWTIASLKAVSIASPVLIYGLWRTRAIQRGYGLMLAPARAAAADAP